MRISEELREIVKSLSKIVQESRALAAQLRENRVSSEAVSEQLNDLTSVVGDAEFAATSISQLTEISDFMPELAKKLDTIRDVVFDIGDVVRTLTYIAIPDIHDAENPNIEIKDEDLDRKMDKLEEHVVKLTGRRCRHKTSNKLSSYLSDLASCVHAIVKHISSLVKTEGKCNIVEDGRGKQFCITWSKATNINRQANLYADIDYINVEGWVSKDKVYLQLGGMEKAYVDLEKGTLKYLDDRVSTKVLEDILEEYAGLNCKSYGRTLTCTGITDDNMKKVALALSMATSMEYRIMTPEDFWELEYRVEGERVMTLQRLKELEKKLFGK